MSPSVAAIRLLVWLLLNTAMVAPVQAQTNDMFASKAAAEKRARELNCTGAFAMGTEWMPCKDFDAYQKAVRRKS